MREPLRKLSSKSVADEARALEVGDQVARHAAAARKQQKQHEHRQPDRAGAGA